MLLPLYLLFTILAFVFFAVALLYGSALTKVEGITPDHGIKPKKGIALVLMMMSMLFFIILSFSSMNVQTEHCESQINQTVVTGNTTDYTNDISCETKQYVLDHFAYIYSFFAIISFIFMMYYSVLTE